MVKLFTVEKVKSHSITLDKDIYSKVKECNYPFSTLCNFMLKSLDGTSDEYIEELKLKIKNSTKAKAKSEEKKGRYCITLSLFQTERLKKNGFKLSTFLNYTLRVYFENQKTV